MVVHRSLTWRSFVYRGWSSNRFRSTSCCGVLNAPLVSLSLYTKNIQKRNGETPWNNPGQAHCVSPGRINSASSRSEFRMPIPRKQGLKKLGFMAGIVRQISMQHDTTIKCATGRSEGVFFQISEAITYWKEMFRFCCFWNLTSDAVPLKNMLWIYYESHN